MKKIDFALAAMILMLAVLSSNLLAPRITAQSLTCLTLSNCCGAAGCSGPGTPNGCAATCSGGGSITCETVKNGKCGGEGELD